MDFDETFVGVYGNFWEYRRTINRRLFIASEFSSEESIKIGKQLEGFFEFNCYKKVEYNGFKFYIYIDKHGRVFYPLSKNGRKIRSPSLDYLVELSKKL